MPKIRYADVLLNLAEALNEQGKIDEAVTVVNQVRARAGPNCSTPNVPTTVMGQVYSVNVSGTNGIGNCLVKT